MDNFSGLWLADFIGSFLSPGGDGVYYFHYLPLAMERGCNNSVGTFGMFCVDADYRIQQPMAQFFASQMINREWLDRAGGEHHVYPAVSDVQDGAGHTLVSAYAVQRPDQHWAVMLVNKDQHLDHAVHLKLDDETTHVSSFLGGKVMVSVFGSQQYRWNSRHREFNAHLPVADEGKAELETPASADPDQPPAITSVEANAMSTFELPAASIVVVRGKIAKP